MSKGVELTEKELKEVSGGAYIANGYLYFYADGKNQKMKVLFGEEGLTNYVATLTNQGYSDEQILAGLNIFADHFGNPEDC